MRSNSAKTMTKDQEPSQANQCLTKVITMVIKLSS